MKHLASPSRGRPCICVTIKKDRELRPAFYRDSAIGLPLNLDRQAKAGLLLLVHNFREERSHDIPRRAAKSAGLLPRSGKMFGRHKRGHANEVLANSAKYSVNATATVGFRISRNAVCLQSGEFAKARSLRTSAVRYVLLSIHDSTLQYIGRCNIPDPWRNSGRAQCSAHV